MTVTYTVIGIRLHGTFIGTSPVHKTSKPSGRAPIIFLFEISISQVIESQTVFLSALVGGKFQIQAVIITRLRETVQTVIGLSPPEIGVRLCRLIVLPHSQRLVEEIQSLLKTGVRKSLCAQPEQNLLLGLHNPCARMLNLCDGL